MGFLLMIKRMHFIFNKKSLYFSQNLLNFVKVRLQILNLIEIKL
jgi:hypothetical protein